MDYEEFISCVKNGMSDILGEDVKVKVHKVLKNNDIELDALTVLKNDSNMSPTIYLNYYYDEYTGGRDIGDIVNEIYGLYEEHSKKLNFDMDVFSDFEKIKSRIAFKLINTKSNAKLLKDIPHVHFLDLSIVFYCLLDNEYVGTATALIHNIHKDMWNVSTEELLKIAKENTPRLLEYELKNMNELIREILVDDLQKTIYERDDRYDKNCFNPGPEEVADGLMKNITGAKEQIAMYVLTNRQRTNGAICMLYDDVIKNFAEKINSDMYILPSSVHEVILVPAAEGIFEKELTDMVREVNKEELDRIDVLSDHAYYYCRETDEITISNMKV